VRAQRRQLFVWACKQAACELASSAAQRQASSPLLCTSAGSERLPEKKRSPHAASPTSKPTAKHNETIRPHANPPSGTGPTWTAPLPPPPARGRARRATGPRGPPGAGSARTRQARPARRLRLCACGDETPNEAQGPRARARTCQSLHVSRQRTRRRKCHDERRPRASSAALQHVHPRRRHDPVGTVPGWAAGHRGQQPPHQTPQGGRLQVRKRRA
jgi:hypothetical protein